MPLGVDNINLPSEELQRKMYEMSIGSGGGGDAPAEGKKKWRRGEMEFEALMRHLDNCVCIQGKLFSYVNVFKFCAARTFVILFT